MSGPLGELEAALALPTLLDTPLLGWRLWDVSSGDLRAMNGSPWATREPLIAHCKATNHEAPVRECSCGLYAAKTLSDLTDAGYGLAKLDATTAIGTVKLWGKVIPHKRGWRAQYAYPDYVIVRDPLVAELLRRNYGCDVRVSEAPPKTAVETVTVAPVQGGGVPNVRLAPPPGHMGGTTPMLRINIQDPQGCMFTYCGVADSKPIAEWFAGFCESMFKWGSQPGAYNYRWQYDVSGWWQ